MSEGFEKLPGRALVRISGEDSEHFLENLVTCRIEGLAAGDAAFGGLLSPQGKVLFDFFVIVTGEAYLIDLDQSLAEEFVKRMRFYKLRAKVEIEPAAGNDGVVAGWGDRPEGLDGVTITDPRLPEMGWRTYGDNSAIEAGNQYRAHRIDTGMPAGGEDFEYGDGFPHDCLMDQFGGVDFKKGCYVGQEVVSRMQHRGTARKRIVKISAENSLPKPARHSPYRTSLSAHLARFMKTRDWRWCGLTGWQGHGRKAFR